MVHEPRHLWFGELEFAFQRGWAVKLPSAFSTSRLRNRYVGLKPCKPLREHYLPPCQEVLNKFPYRVFLDTGWYYMILIVPYGSSMFQLFLQIAIQEGRPSQGASRKPTRIPSSLAESPSGAEIQTSPISCSAPRSTCGEQEQVRVPSHIISQRRCLMGEQTCSAWLGPYICHAGSPALPAWCKHIPHVWILSWILFLNTTPSKLFKVDLTLQDILFSSTTGNRIPMRRDLEVKSRLCFSPSPDKEHLVPPTMDSSVFCLDRRFPHPRPALDLQGYPQVHLMLWHRHLGGRCQK